MFGKTLRIALIGTALLAAGAVSAQQSTSTSTSTSNSFSSGGEASFESSSSRTVNGVTTTTTRSLTGLDALRAALEAFGDYRSR